MSTFESFFRSAEPARDKYLARLFGLFSEQVVRAWCSWALSPYEDLGRPTLRILGEPQGSTLDFTLRERESGRVFASELKCELEYGNYRYLRLVHPGQLAHHQSVAFQRFLLAAREPAALEVRCKGQPIEVNGGILIWGAATPAGREAAMEAFGFADVLSVEDMVADLQDWKPEGWSRFLDDHRRWTNELFGFLA